MTIRVIRAGEHIQHIPGWGMTVRESGVAVATSNWWEVPGKTCVAAYQPKGAASYAASKTNLANPGTYDATLGPDAGAPDWSSSTGWHLDNTHWFTTGVLAQGTWSIICRIGSYTESGGQNAFGNQAYRGFAVGPYWYGARVYGTNGGENAIAPKAPQDSVLCLAGKKVYVDGTDWGFNLPGTAKNQPVCIPDDAGTFRMNGLWYAGAIYSGTLSQSEVQALSTLMGAL